MAKFFYYYYDYLLAFIICQSCVQMCGAAFITSILSQITSVSSVNNSTVCGYNGTTYELFDNKNIMRQKYNITESSENEFTMAPLGCCLLKQEKKSSCKEIVPICAMEKDTSHMKTFNNTCLMNRTACQQNVDWRLHKSSSCDKTKLTKTVPCLRVYKPVCAIYAGVKSTFSNECLVNAENLRTGADWRIDAENICVEDYIHRVAREAISGNQQRPPLNTYNNIQSAKADLTYS